MKVLHTIRETPPNLAGLCTLSINSDNCYLAYPGSNTIGEVQIFDATNLVCLNNYYKMHSTSIEMKSFVFINHLKCICDKSF